MHQAVNRSTFTRPLLILKAFSTLAGVTKFTFSLILIAYLRLLFARFIVQVNTFGYLQFIDLFLLNIFWRLHAI